MNIILISFLILSIIINIALFIDDKRNKKIANTDSLTGLLNRRQFELDFYLSNSRRNTDAKYLIIIDIDNFKRINDNLGHRNGDTILHNLAEDMVQLVRKTDKIYRIGGDEFAILTSSPTIFKKLRSISNISSGKAIITNNKDKTFNIADKAMYLHKEGKK